MLVVDAPVAPVKVMISLPRCAPVTEKPARLVRIAPRKIPNQ
jgi:hypothetical protein